MQWTSRELDVGKSGSKTQNNILSQNTILKQHFIIQNNIFVSFFYLQLKYSNKVHAMRFLFIFHYCCIVQGRSNSKVGLYTTFVVCGLNKFSSKKKKGLRGWYKRWGLQKIIIKTYCQPHLSMFVHFDLVRHHLKHNRRNILYQYFLH